MLYRVFLTRPCSEDAIVIVEADDEDDARDLAFEKTSELHWDPGDYASNDVEAYEIEEIDPETEPDAEEGEELRQDWSAKQDAAHAMFEAMQHCPADLAKRLRESIIWLLPMSLRKGTPLEFAADEQAMHQAHVLATMQKAED